jgi:hypothetical protein
MKRRLIAALAIALMLVATMSLPAIAANEGTVTASVTVTSYISITITDAGTAGIHFGTLAPGTNDNPDTDANDTTPSINVGVNAGSTVNVDLQLQGTDFGTGFAVTNAKYSTDHAGAKTALSTSYADFATNIAPGSSVDLWHWLDVPSSGVAAGDYNSTFSYKAIEH